ncbi:glutamate 5-kinase [bacterium]|nr:glutamate 5-kinase [bacterium]
MEIQYKSTKSNLLSAPTEYKQKFNRQEFLQSVKRIVVKVGTSSLITKDFKLNKEGLDNLAADLVSVKQSGREVILVTSGAIGTGVGRIGLKHRPQDIPSQQAAAAVGQSLLMSAYEERFRRYNLPIAQMLLTQDDLRNRKRYTNASNTLHALLRYGVIPIINENDTVAVEEIKFGDNDTLSALVTNLADADLLLILSDTDGFYTDDPRKNATAKLINIVPTINAELKKAAGKKGSAVGTGGMETKLKAAQIVTGSGVNMALANSFVEKVVSRLLDGEEIGTLFLAEGERKSGWKRWIAYSLPIKGTLQVDTGAYIALTEHGKSLLPSGLINVTGNFKFGDAVSCLDDDGSEFARGLVNYNANEVNRIKGKRTGEIEGILGHRHYDEVIHRDNLVILRENF